MTVPDPSARVTPECRRVAQLLTRIGDKWSVLVIVMLGQKSQRFSELKRGIGGVFQRMLTGTLRNLERDGLVSRTVTPTIPPRVDYELTDLGRSLAMPVQALGEWAFAHLDEIDVAHAAWEAKQSSTMTDQRGPAI